jgi:hypothetical protein
VRGSAADSTSGVESASCGAVAGTIAGQTFTCDVPVGIGSTPLTIEARDRSGHVSTANVTIVVGDQPPPTAISISPATMTMIMGETRRLSVHDEYDRRVIGGTWTVSNPSVAEVIVENNEVSVRAVGSGQATLMLARDALTAQATVDVLLAGSTPLSGTTLWSLTPATPDPVLRGEVLRALWVDAPDGVEHPSLFFVDEGMEWDATWEWIRPWERPTRIRATTVDGRELWEHVIDGPILRQVASDNHGGITVLLESWYDYDDNARFYPDTIRRIDGFTGAVSWEYAAAYTNASTSSLSEFAIHPDGRVFVVEDGGGPDNITDLISLDGASGLQFRWSLPGGVVSDGPTAAIATHPLVREDGSVVLLSNRWGITSEVQLVTLPSAGGQLSLQAVNGTAANWTGIVALNGYRIMPDGQGGLLITNNVFEKHAGDGTSAWRLDTNYVVSARVNLAAPGFGETGTVYHADYVLAEDGAYALFEGQGQTGYWAKAVAFDPVNLTVTSQAFLSMPGVLPRYLQTRMALGGGGVYISGPFEAYAVNASVDASAFGAGGNAAHVAAEEWTGWSGGPATAIGGHVVHAVTTYSQPQGGRGHKEQDPRLGIFGKTHDVGFLGTRHIAIRIAPSNQPYWRQQAPTMFSKRDSFSGDHYFGMLGAGPIPENAVDACIGSLLVAGINRTRDWEVPPLNPPGLERLPISPTEEDNFIGRLIQLQMNYPNSLDYECDPAPFTDGYNSNSYARGLLEAAKLPILRFPGWKYGPLSDPRYAGWQKPVPPQHFAPH